MVVNGFVNVVITTIERRFGLRSSQSGLVAGGYDIASFLCLVPVTYLGGRAGASKPRWIAWGIVLMGESRGARREKRAEAGKLSHRLDEE